MKVNGNNPIAPVLSVAQSPRSAEQPETAGEKRAEDQVHISEDARWISELRAQAQRQPAIRSELVSQVQSQLADGSFEAGVDMDVVLEGLLADL